MTGTDPPKPLVRLPSRQLQAQLALSQPLRWGHGPPTDMAVGLPVGQHVVCLALQLIAAVKQPELMAPSTGSLVFDKRVLTLADSSTLTPRGRWILQTLVFLPVEELNSDHNLPLLQ